MSASETRIWMFHRVLPDTPTAFGRTGCYRLRGTAVTPAELSDFLGRSTPIALRSVLRALQRDAPLPPGDVLTFDDGYREWLTLLPLLQGAPASFYLTTDMHADAAQAHPVDVYYWLLDNAREPRFRIELAGDHFEGSLESDAGKKALVCGGPLKRAVASGPHPEALLEQLTTALSLTIPDDLPSRLYLRRQDWGALVEAGHELGAHGTSHVHLTGLDEAALARSLRNSAHALNATTVAYPDGDYNDRVINAARDAGLVAGLTCEPDALQPGSDPMRLPRHFATPKAVAA